METMQRAIAVVLTSVHAVASRAETISGEGLDGLLKVLKDKGVFGRLGEAGGGMLLIGLALLAVAVVVFFTVRRLIRLAMDHPEEAKWILLALAAFGVKDRRPKSLGGRPKNTRL
jgi:hypothetical protein